MGEVLTLLFRSRRFIAGLIMFICVLAFGLFGPLLLRHQSLPIRRRAL